MSFITDIARTGGFIVGAVSQVVNSITNRIVLPISIIPPAPPGDVLEPVGDAARAGADAVEAAIDAIFGGTGRVDANAARERRRLLGSANIAIDARDTVSHLTFSATAVGADWSRAGQESGRVAIYVDGRYQSSVTVLAERDGTYTVNLGLLPPGTHSIEIREANELAGAHAPSVAVSGMRHRVLTGDEALIERHSPIIELRDSDRSGVHSSSHGDTPMLMVPSVSRHPDGTKTIEYRVAFSNEEGGTKLPVLMSKYGRTADLEPAYTVHVAADGSVISAQYQSAMHHWKPFDGTKVGDRPVLRVATANSNFSTRVHAAGAGDERWSEAAIEASSPARSDFEVMRDHPWTWTVMAKEIVREGKSTAPDAVRGSDQIGDPRRYLYVGPLTDALRGAIARAGGIEVTLANGRRVLAKIVEGYATGGYGQTALELPAGVSSDAVTGVTLLGVQALVIEADFGVRELARAA